MMVEEKGYDFYKILNALSDDYPRAKHFARAGFAAGPCLFKDTMQLSAFYNNKFFLGQAGMLVNEGLPDFVVSQLERKMGSLKDKKIAILGMTFKPNNDDTRESLSFKLRKNLEFRMSEVLIHDPYLNTASLDDIYQRYTSQCFDEEEDQQTHISTYAARKTYGYNIYKECIDKHNGLLPGTDINALQYVQSVFNHNSSMTTLRYIGAYDTPATQLAEDIANQYDF